MTHFVVSSSLKRVERLEHLERLEPAKSGRFISFADTSQLAARMKVRRTLRSLGEGGWKGFGEFRKIPRSFAPRSFI